MNSLSEYRKGERAGYTWSATFSIRPGMRFSDIVSERLANLVLNYADPQLSVSGAVLGKGLVSSRNTLILGLDPSQTYGTPSIERCEEVAHAISDIFKWRRLEEELPELRVILGRRIGYLSDGAFSMNKVIEQVGDNESLHLREADLFSLRYVEGVRQYSEPAAVIHAPASSLPDIAELAKYFGQYRFVAEFTGIETQVYTKPSN